MVNNPNIRFAGFSDEWVRRKLGDVVEKQIKGKAQFEKLAPGEVEYLDTSRLNGGQAILTNGIKDVTLDDILILWDGSKAGTVYHGFEGALGSTLKAYKTSANSKFVYQYLKRHQDNIYNNYRTPNIPHVQKDFLNVFTISVPNTNEQQKIGSVFGMLDHKIGLEERQIALLKNLKKGYLQKMFPKNCATVPEWRFAGFADDWEECKLGDVSNIKNGKGHSGLTQGNIPMYGTGGYISDVNASLSDVDAIGIGHMGTIGKPHILKSPFWAINTLFYAVPHDDVDINFVMYSLTTFEWSKYNETIAVPTIPLDRVKTTKLKLPSKQEQQKVGQIISLIDSIIDNYSREVTQLELLKKGLLQNIFI